MHAEYLSALRANEVGHHSALADRKMKARLGDLGGTIIPGSPAQFAKLIVDKTEKRAKVIKFADLKADRPAAEQAQPMPLNRRHRSLSD